MSRHGSPSEPQSPTDKQTTSPQTQSPIPLDSLVRTYHKSGLVGLSSTYPHGLLSGLPRSASQQSALEARKEEILRTMTKKEMERAYEDKVKEVVRVLEAHEERKLEVEAEMDKLRIEREMERRVWGKLRASGGG